jgi:hypothetical protein
VLAKVLSDGTEVCYCHFVTIISWYWGLSIWNKFVII